MRDLEIRAEETFAIVSWSSRYQGVDNAFLSRLTGELTIRCAHRVEWKMYKGGGGRLKVTYKNGSNEAISARMRNDCLCILADTFQGAI